MDSRLNFFAPYQHVPASHENQLTRALLVVLRYSPAAHDVWLRMVAPDRHLHALGKAEFATQRERILERPQDAGAEEAIPGISVWLAPDAEHAGAEVTASDRGQILDGIITYGTDLVVVIENKITWSKVTHQPQRINLHGSPVLFSGGVVSVKWQDLLEALSNLADRDDLVALTDRLLIGDFFEFVEQHFPRLGPYSNLARCAGHRSRLNRRLDALMGTAAHTSEGKDLGWRNLSGTPKLFMAWLGLKEDSPDVYLRMYPADTLGQARAFYKDAASVREVLSLRSHGWIVKPNFHWGFTATGYAWSESPMTADAYCDYWRANIASTGEVPRQDWNEYWGTLQHDGIVSAGARAEFDNEFTNTGRNKAHARPGLACEFRWSLTEATQLDSRGRFADEVRTRVNEMLQALRAPELPEGAHGRGNDHADGTGV